MNATIKIFNKVEDKRIERKKLYPLIEIIVVALGTILCGGETYVDMYLFGRSKLDFLRKILPFKNGIPSEDTFERVFRLINSKQFQACFFEWVEHVKEELKKVQEEQKEQGKEVLSVDGKTIRGSGKQGKNPLQILNAFSSEYGIAVGAMAIEEGKNEISTIPPLLNLLNLEKTIVTSDAIACQITIVNQISAQNGEFVIALKKNQGNLYDDVKTFFDLEKSSLLTDKNHYETINKDHGRLEKRNYFFTTNVNWLIQRNPEWNAIKSIGCVVGTRTVDNKETTETRFFISNITDSILTFARAVRDHWGIENSLHHVLDVILREDNSKVRDRIAAENLSIIRKITLNLLVLSQKTINTGKKKLSKRSMRIKAAWDNSFFETLLLQLF